MKILQILLPSVLATILIFGIAIAANTFPTTLNTWSDGDVIESDWANTLETKIGIDGSADTDSLDYKISHITLSNTLDAANNIITNIGNAGTDFDSSGRLNLSTDQLWTQATGHLSDVIRLQWENNTAKPAITWYDENGVAQTAIVAHDYLAAGNRHHHISFETKNNTDDQLHTRFECLFDADTDDDGGYCGVASSYDLKVGSGGDLYIVDGNIEHGADLDICSDGQTAKCVRIGQASDENPQLQALGSDTLRIDDNIEMRTTGSMIYMNSSNVGDYASTIRLTGESSNDHYKGGYLQFDALGNEFIIGVHDTADELTSSDIEAIGIARTDGKINFKTEVNLNDGNIISVGDINVDSISAAATSVNYEDVNIFELTQEDVGATCTLGQIRFDTGGATKELCYCEATNTWACVALGALAD